MIQERVETDRRRFIPWTWWDDHEWRPFEPEGGLPFFKPQRARLNRIMLHEGAKAAEFAERTATDPLHDHPWREELAKWEHWGLLGGAMIGHKKADRNELRAAAPEALAYACDNDNPGLEMLPKVSEAWGMSLMGVEYPRRWPDGWDIADDIPLSFSVMGATSVQPSGTFLPRGRRTQFQPGTQGDRVSCLTGILLKNGITALSQNLLVIS